MRNLDVKSSVLFGFSSVLGSTPAMGQSQVFAYPVGGQSEEQVSRDKFECHQWSVGQTGFNPTTAAPLPARAAVPPPNQGYNQGYSDRRRRSNRGFLGIGDGGMFQGGGMMGDAATGAALGAAGGAIAGDAGKGVRRSAQFHQPSLAQCHEVRALENRHHNSTSSISKRRPIKGTSNGLSELMNTIGPTALVCEAASTPSIERHLDSVHHRSIAWMALHWSCRESTNHSKITDSALMACILDWRIRSNAFW